MTIFPHFQNLTILCVFDVSGAFFCFQKMFLLLKKKNTRLAIMCFASQEPIRWVPGFAFSTFWKFEVQRQNKPFLIILPYYLSFTKWP